MSMLLYLGSEDHHTKPNMAMQSSNCAGLCLPMHLMINNQTDHTMTPIWQQQQQ